MMRSFRVWTLVAVGLTVALSFPCRIMAAPATLDLRWYGHSFFMLETSKGTRVAFDPHNIQDYGRIELTADVVLVSHEHDDHNNLGAVKVRVKENVIHGLKPAKPGARQMEWNVVDKTIDDVHIRSVGTYHDNEKGLKFGLNTVFVVDADGFRVVHLGDLGHTLTKEQIKQIGPVDLLLIPVGGVYTINGYDAKDVVEQLKPRYGIVPMHYGTPAFDTLLSPESFLEDVPKERIKRVVGPLRLEIDRKPPKEPTIYLMNFK
jgi:L-ascorbate metabolism protein UlaG (beta-lactamase superfamily)